MLYTRPLLRSKSDKIQVDPERVLCYIAVVSDSLWTKNSQIQLQRPINFTKHTLLQNKRHMAVVRGGPPPIIFEGRNLPQPTIYYWKGNLSKSSIHFRYRQNILISRLYEQFSRNDSTMAPQWLQKKFQTFKI